ncbi:YceI family protein [Brumicola nitratireducens]|uniref:Cytochrome b561 n=1 Tax=Glaciecola nitratireducens (strain JCM 12485 / KCTC 12276 / FR1064) TaxID=1085623 RepID=G4QEH1_GLANF|nr:YceI family protein [Glaciecola nitratireducens]AEP28734.1 cytochrome b561 [Glaciecola nitratireducens FR1064]
MLKTLVLLNLTKINSYKTNKKIKCDYLLTFYSTLCIALALTFAPLAAAQQKLTFSAKDSTVSFAGEHVGMKFSGVFNKWNAELVLPPADSPTITATFYVASAKTGDSTYDSTLPEGDWFDVKNHPKGLFESEQIISKGNDYDVTGNLTLRGISQPVSFLLKDNGATLSANFSINRLAYKIGFESDPAAEWVSEEIDMTLLLNK